MVEAGEITAERFVGVLRGDATRLPFADGTFDVVITSEVLEHIQDDVARDRRDGPRAAAGRHVRGHRAGWFPEKINWMLSRRVPRAQERRAATSASTRAPSCRPSCAPPGSTSTGSHHAHALHSPYWWLRCAVGPQQRRPPARSSAYREFLEWDIVKQPRQHAHRRPGRCRRCSARASCSTPRSRRRTTRVGRSRMSALPDLPGVLTADEVRRHRRRTSPSLQLPSGMIPWFPGGHCDPWNHVESAMALDVAGLHDEAERAYDWLADIQRPDGSWHNYYRPTTARRGTPSSTPTCAPTSPPACGTTGAAPATAASSTTCGRPSSGRSTGCSSLRRHDGTIALGRRADERAVGLRPAHRLVAASSTRCAAAPRSATRPGRARPDWVDGRRRDGDRRSPIDPSAFEPKDRWAMDWYYPVLTGATRSARPPRPASADGWDDVRDGGARRPLRRATSRGSRRRRRPSARSRSPRSATSPRRPTCCGGPAPIARRRDGWRTGPASCTRHANVFPADEHTSYTAAAVILAADAITRRIAGGRPVRAPICTRLT